MNALTLHAGANAVTYDELRAVKTPDATDSHLPVPHHEIVGVMRYTLGFFGHEVAEEHLGLTKTARATLASCACAAHTAATQTCSACAIVTTRGCLSASPLARVFRL